MVGASVLELIFVGSLLRFFPITREQVDKNTQTKASQTC
jgi:hypothetical protein